jgi:hypothetical protein
VAVSGSLGGPAFDGSHVYYAGYHAGSGSVSARFDTAGDFLDKTAWATFEPVVKLQNDAAKGLSSTAFDGRYVYLISSSTNVVLRHDSTAEFTDAGAWRFFDPGPLSDPALSDFRGAVYDGRYLYLVPSNGVVARFEARRDVAMPCLPAFYGSFY